MRLPMGNDWPTIRIVVPAHATNVYSKQAERTTPLGPLKVATAANTLWDWRVQVIDENNYIGPRDARGLPDHEALDSEQPATVVGFYCGHTATMKRVEELAQFYVKQGAVTIAGSWHAHYRPEEVLRCGVDYVAHGDADYTIVMFLNSMTLGGGWASDIPGLSFLRSDVITTNPGCPRAADGLSRVSVEIENLDLLKHPDFGLLHLAKGLKTYPISRIYGCGMMCEFCSVRGEPRWASARHLFNTVRHLVETRGARNFFIVDDRLEQDAKGTREFFELIRAKYGNRLQFAAQVRLGIAEQPELLELMKSAGVGSVFIG